MTQTIRLSIVLAINLFMITGLIVVGFSSHSISVLAAGGDYAADAGAIGLGLIAIMLQGKSPKYHKATSYVALINGLFLLIITSFVIYEAGHRLLSQTTPIVAGLQTMLISGLAAIAMVVAALVLRSGDDTRSDLHIRSVMLDTAADASSAGAVAVTGAIIYLTHGFYWLDSIIGLSIGVVIGIAAVKLLHDVAIDFKRNANKVGP